NGRAARDSATAHALALQFGLLREPARRQHAGERLGGLVREAGYRVSTGFVGTPLVCDALCDVGAHDLAFRLLVQRACPSWLYPVTMGATTVWERWDSLMPDGRVNPGEMTSFNHYALGAIADWLHRVVGGLAPAEPGYRRLAVAPRPGGGLTHARARHRTPYGPAECAWRIEAGRMHVEVVVPPNTTATVTLPDREGPPVEVGAGSHSWTYDRPAPPPRRRLSLESTVAELVDELGAWQAVLARAPELAPLELGLQTRASMPLWRAVALLHLPDPQNTAAALESALADLREAD
ncbi:MAG TPA: alpha-L-rhamnosidase C-terminal domain-containing protein, partial [Chloroflexota bacterium]